MDRFQQQPQTQAARPAGPAEETMTVKRKIALVLSSHPPGRETAQKMAKFLKEELTFDHVTYSKGLT